MLKKRNELGLKDRERKSAVIARKLNTLPVYARAKTVMFFMTHSSEVQTEIMIERALTQGKMVAVPITSQRGNTLKAARIVSSNKGLKKGRYGIPEPARRVIIPKGKIDAIIVPGIAFDKQGNRIGYGKGYYDSWLNDIPREKTIALGFDFQVVDTLPHNKNDVPVGCIITEKRIIRNHTPVR